MKKRSFYREKILEVMGDHAHWSARQLFDHLHDMIPTLSVVTVYRNLHALENEGKVRRVIVGEETLWERVSHPPHFHFHCRVCGKVIDLPVDLTPILQHTAPIGRAEHFHGVVEGICQTCLDGDRSHEQTKSGNPTSF